MLKKPRAHAFICFIFAVLSLSGCADDDATESVVDTAVARDASDTTPRVDVLTDADDVEDIADTVSPADIPDDTGGAEDIPDIPFVVTPHPLDDVLRFNHLQTLGTHNSYHIDPGFELPDWMYTHLPLNEQLSVQGVRQLELDLYWRESRGHFEVYHLPSIDAETTCLRFTDCLQILKRWSNHHGSHQPLLILLEVKEASDALRVPEWLATIEAEILSVWPRERLIVPDDVQRDAPNLRDGLATHGWPLLGVLRGRVLFVLHDNDQWRDAHLGVPPSTADRVMFPDAYGDPALPYAAYHSMNNPFNGDAIRAVVEAGHLVRTRADSSGEEARALDYSRLDAALASGAHFVSTDFPGPRSDTDYGVSIPAGTPSRCNPVADVPVDCVPTSIEDPALLLAP